MLVICAHSSLRFLPDTFIYTGNAVFLKQQYTNCMGNSTVLSSGVGTVKLSALVRKEDNLKGYSG